MTDVCYHFIRGKSFVFKLSLLLYVIFQCHTNVIGTTIKYGIATQYPFFLGYIVWSNFTGMLEHPFKKMTMNVKKLPCGKRERLFIEQFSNVRRDFLSLIDVNVRPIVRSF